MHKWLDEQLDNRSNLMSGERLNEQLVEIFGNILGERLAVMFR